MSVQTDSIVIVGLGAQAVAWSQNLRDSGRRVQIALRTSSASWKKAQELKLPVLDLDSGGFSDERLYVLLASDQQHLNILENLRGRAPQGSAFIYAHGYSMISENVAERFPEWDHFLLAPKAIASEVRREYLEEGKLAAVYSVEHASHRSPHDAAQLVLGLARDLGITAGPYPSTFAEETKADLLSEQSLLCSLLPYGALASYRVLRKRGVSPELAYLECWHEVRLIADAMLRAGPAGLMKLISPNALVGGQKARELFFDKSFDAKLEKLAEDVWDGTFFQEMKGLGSDRAEDLRSQVVAEWETEEITGVHRKLFPDLYEKTR